MHLKNHLKDLFRPNLEQVIRNGFLRLDMNEGVPGLPADFIKETCDLLSPDRLSSYPEYGRLIELIAADNGVGLENICLSNGSDAAIKYIFDAYVSSGDKVLVTDPTFAMYPVYGKISNAECVSIPYNQDFSFPFNAFMDKVENGVKMAVVVNPNNPTGSVLEQDKLFEIIKKCFENEVIAVVDEAYFYYYRNTAINFIKEFSNTIVLRTFSKLCGMAAARIGYAVSSPEMIEGLKKVRPTFDVNGLAVLFAQRLLERPDVIDGLIGGVNEGKGYLLYKLRGSGIEHYAGHANFVLIKCNGNVAEIINGLKERNILINGGFKQDFLKDYVRVTVASKSVMERFWNSFVEVYKK